MEVEVSGRWRKGEEEKGGGKIRTGRFVFLADGVMKGLSSSGPRGNLLQISKLEPSESFEADASVCGGCKGRGGGVDGCRGRLEGDEAVGGHEETPPEVLRALCGAVGQHMAQDEAAGKASREYSTDQANERRAAALLTATLRESIEAGQGPRGKGTGEELTHSQPPDPVTSEPREGRHEEAWGVEGRVGIGGDAAAPFRYVIRSLIANHTRLPRNPREAAATPAGRGALTPSPPSHRGALPQAAANPKGRSRKTLSH
ncbi:hypothetical protein E2C01_033282 [Portunus trituberculatus]|uniref:Uncharacterized protein n=1 Tax=Portunus trituberculatus TaxID=210409 RepID=A0A5B7F550_PORTR|nr:hypothetical protein [Portunus trituberculatus]